MTQLHFYTTHQFNASTSAKAFEKSALPPNSSGYDIASALAHAFLLYKNPNAVVMMVVQQGERNVFDQRLIEYSLFSHGIRMIRRTLTDIAEHAFLRETDNALIIDEEVIAVTYFRAGYTPNDYPTEKEWEARKTIEKSFSIKCPNISYHLAGTKKVQQLFSNPAHLKTFFAPSEAEIVDKLIASFTGLYGLDEDDPRTNDIIQTAINSPGRFVLKPQREGGGNNIYGEEVVTFLKTKSRFELSSYILMEVIKPQPYPTIIVRNSTATPTLCTNELGIFSTFISDGDKVIENKAAGHLLRTKSFGVMEGGVAAGFAALDSPYLYNQ